MAIPFASRKRRMYGLSQGGKPAKKAKQVQRRQPYLMRRVERKRKYYGLAPITPRSDVINLYNPLYYLVPGTGRDQRIGNRITGTYLHYSLSVAPKALNALGDVIDQGVSFRIVVFTHTKEWQSGAEGSWALTTGGAGTAPSIAEILKDTGGDRYVQSYLNIDEIKVLHDRYVELPRPELGNAATEDTGPLRLVKGSCRLGDFKFQDGTNAFGRDRNVYVAVMASGAAGLTLVEACRVAANFLVTFDDA